MKSIMNFLRKLLFKLLPFETYLKLLSKGYFLAFNSGMLKKNRQYAYPYFLQEFIRKGDVCIDLGANLGYFSVILAKLVGKEGQVYSVEPVKPIRSVLESNTKKFTQVTIYPFALGLENKPIKLGNDTLDDKGFVASGSHFILDKEVSKEQAQVEFDAQMVKGSELFSPLTKLDFLKCDIEGYEVVVIPEILPIIEKFSPVVLIEARDESRSKMKELFEARDYSSYVLNEGKLISAESDDIHDVLFIPKDKEDRFKQFIQ